MKRTLLIIPVLLLLVVGAYVAFASSVGPNNASTAANVLINGLASGFGGGDAWVNINNSKVVDGVFATGVTCSSCDYATELDQLTGFGFSVPTNATINGIIVTITREQVKFGSPVGPLTDNLLYLDYSNATSSTNKADTVTVWPTTNTAKTYGSSSDLWGGTWTPAKINDSTFGVAFSAIEDYESPSNNGNPYVDGITLTVYYTTSSGVNQVQIRSGNMSIKSGNEVIK